jgi:hypothetical protein
MDSGQAWLRWSRIKRHDPQQRLAVVSVLLIGWIKYGGWKLNLDSRAVAKHSGVARTLHLWPPSFRHWYVARDSPHGEVLGTWTVEQRSECGERGPYLELGYA